MQCTYKAWCSEGSSHTSPQEVNILGRDKVCLQRSRSHLRISQNTNYPFQIGATRNILVCPYDIGLPIPYWVSRREYRLPIPHRSPPPDIYHFGFVEWNRLPIPYRSYWLLEENRLHHNILRPLIPYSASKDWALEENFPYHIGLRSPLPNTVLGL